MIRIMYTCKRFCGLRTTTYCDSITEDILDDILKLISIQIVNKEGKDKQDVFRNKDYPKAKKVDTMK